MDYSKIVEILKTLGELVWALMTLAGRLIAGGLALLGLGHVIQYYGIPEKRFAPPPLPYQAILLDDEVLVRCRKIDRSQPSCTLLSDCYDGIDRCVVTFEILRQLNDAEAQPAEP